MDMETLFKWIKEGDNHVLIESYQSNSCNGFERYKNEVKQEIKPRNKPTILLIEAP